MDNNKQKAWEFLFKNRLATLATVSPENTPHVSFVYYIPQDNFHIYIVIKKDSRKFANITANNKVALLISQEMDPMVLQIEGSAEVVQDQDIMSELTGRYLEIANTNTKSPNWPPIMKLGSDADYIFIDINVDRFKFSDFSQGNVVITEGSTVDWK